jgi:AcrR family transcriptional regulator
VVREKILDAAFQLYMSRPPYEITVEDIAREAGVSKSLIFYHFKNKDNLIEEVAVYGTKKLLTEWEINSVSDFVEISFSTIVNRKPLIEFSMYVAERIARKKRFERFKELLDEIMERHIFPVFVREGVIEPKKIALLISAMLDGLSLYHYFYNIEDIEDYRKVVMEMIRRLKE